MKSYTTAIIGLGRMSRSHLRMIDAVPDFRLVAACDKDREQLGGAELADSVSRFTEVENLMENARPDVVVIVTSSSAHSALVREVARFRPKAILCEKPMSLAYRDALAMLRTCEENDVELLINHQRRIQAGAIGRQAIIDGKIGELREVVIHTPGDFLSDGTHGVDLARTLCGDIPVNAVFGSVWFNPENGDIPRRYGHPVDAAAFARWEDRNGVQCRIYSGTMAPRHGYQHVKISGTKGELWHPGGKTQPRWYLRDGRKGDHTEGFDDKNWYWLPTPAEGGQWRCINPEEAGNPMQTSLELLADLLNGSIDSHPLNGRTALHVQEIVNAVYLSAYRRQPVSLPLPESEGFAMDDLVSGLQNLTANETP